MDKPKHDIVRRLGVLGAGRDGHRRRWPIILIAAAVLAAGAALWLSGRGGGSPQYQTEDARRGDLTVTVTATGTLQPTDQVDVSSELSGIVKTVDVDYNDRVKVGQVLATLDTSKLKAQVLEARAALSAARAQVATAKATVLETRLKYDRCVSLAKRQMCSPQDVDADRAAYLRAQAQQEGAQAAVAQGQATLDAIETDLQKAVIRSPIDGIVLKRAVEPGQTVASSLQAPVLFTLAQDLTKMELHVDVDEADVGQVKVGQPATFTVDAYPDRTFPARITQVRYGSTTVQGVVTYETLLNVDNSDLSLRPGMTATADIVVQQLRDVLLVPNAALRFSPPAAAQTTTEERGGGVFGRLFPHPPSATKPQPEARTAREQKVWTLRGGRPEPIDIVTGATDGVMSQVTSGDLAAGTPLIVEAAPGRP